MISFDFFFKSDADIIMIWVFKTILRHNHLRVFQLLEIHVERCFPKMKSSFLII